MDKPTSYKKGDDVDEIEEGETVTRIKDQGKSNKS